VNVLVFIMKAKDKLKKWVDENPEGYLEMSFREIANEIGISHSTVDRNLIRIIAERDGLLPSQVKFKRSEAGFTFTTAGDTKLSDEQINKIHELWNQGFYDLDDIAYIVKVDKRTVEKYLSKIERS